MSRNARLGVLAAVIAAAIAAFFLLRPGDDTSTTATTPTPTTTAATTVTRTTTATTTTATTTTTPPEPAVTRISVKGGEPVGGVTDVTVAKGERIRVRVTADAPESVHLHGYDIEKPVGPGQPARFDVPATITGVFEMELENSAVQIAKVTVEP